MIARERTNQRVEGFVRVRDVAKGGRRGGDRGDDGSQSKRRVQESNQRVVLPGEELHQSTRGLARGAALERGYGPTRWEFETTRRFTFGFGFVGGASRGGPTREPRAATKRVLPAGLVATGERRGGRE